MATIAQGCNTNGRYTLKAADYNQAGFTEATFDVDVDIVTPYNEGYSSGYTDGFSSGMTSGHTEGMADQKALLSSCTLNYNDTFVRADGWSSVTVNVPTVVNNTTLSITADPTWINQHQSPVVFTPDSQYSGYRQVTIDTGGIQLTNLLNTQSTITANGTYTLSGATNMFCEKMMFEVALPLANVQLTQNGTYSASTQGYAGYSVVSVNVSGGSQSQIVTLTQAQYNALNPPDPSIIYLIKD